MSTARDRAEQADFHSSQAAADADLARIHAKQFDPSFVVQQVSALRISTPLYMSTHLQPAQTTTRAGSVPPLQPNHIQMIPPGTQPVMPVNPLQQYQVAYALVETFFTQIFTSQSSFDEAGASDVDYSMQQPSTSAAQPMPQMVFAQQSLMANQVSAFCALHL